MLGFDRGRMDRADYEALAGVLGVARPRVLAWSATSDGLVAVLADRFVVLRGETWTAIRWPEIVTGGWDHRENALRWTTETGEGSAELTAPGDVPDAFNERVSASLVLQHRLDVPGTRGATLFARRDPADPAAAIVWRVLPGRGMDLADEGVRRALLAAVEDAKRRFDIG